MSIGAADGERRRHRPTAGAPEDVLDIRIVEFDPDRICIFRNIVARELELIDRERRIHLSGRRPNGKRKIQFTSPHQEPKVTRVGRDDGLQKRRSLRIGATVNVVDRDEPAVIVQMAREPSSEILSAMGTLIRRAQGSREIRICLRRRSRKVDTHTSNDALEIAVGGGKAHERNATLLGAEILMQQSRLAITGRRDDRCNTVGRELSQPSNESRPFNLGPLPSRHRTHTLWHLRYAADCPLAAPREPGVIMFRFASNQRSVCVEPIAPIGRR